MEVEANNKCSEKLSKFTDGTTTELLFLISGSDDFGGSQMGEYTKDIVSVMQKFIKYVVGVVHERDTVSPCSILDGERLTKWMAIWMSPSKDSIDDRFSIIAAARKSQPFMEEVNRDKETEVIELNTGEKSATSAENIRPDAEHWLGRCHELHRRWINRLYSLLYDLFRQASLHQLLVPRRGQRDEQGQRSDRSSHSSLH